MVAVVHHLTDMNLLQFKKPNSKSCHPASKPLSANLKGYKSNFENLASGENLFETFLQESTDTIANSLHPLKYHERFIKPPGRLFNFKDSKSELQRERGLLERGTYS